jgi:hypothetical protein
VFAASAYNLLQTERPVKEIVKHYYYEIVGPNWPAERALIERFEKGVGRPASHKTDCVAIGFASRSQEA